MYDFSGSPVRYYRATYASSGAPELVDQVAALMPDNEHVERTARGLDHGAYVPLSVMYPEADIPVLQMSMPTLGPSRLLEIGERLRALHEGGVMIIGSGFTTPGLPFLTSERRRDPSAPPPGWSVEFESWAHETLARGDVETLSAFRDRAPGMPHAHPRVEHFVPMFVTLGAADDAEAPSEEPIDGFWMGLAKRSFQVA